MSSKFLETTLAANARRPKSDELTLQSVERLFEDLFPASTDAPFAAGDAEEQDV